MKQDLKAYRSKRDFSGTAEPQGGEMFTSAGDMFVVHKHAARRLHYDLRLEAGGVLRSWAVPKGPSYDPSVKRLAVHVEDHPIEYGGFEGNIPEGQYGAGTVMIWDKGTWHPVGDWKEGLRSGKLKFDLKGRKLKGRWSLVKMNGRGKEDADIWLLIKEHDREAQVEYDVTEEETFSVETGRAMEDIKAEADEIARYGSGRSSPMRERSEGGTKILPVQGRKAPWPNAVSPQLSTPVSRAPEGDQWLNEIKFDGYRILAHIKKKGHVLLMTRGDQDWSEKFGLIAHELSRLPIENGVLDGEVVVQNPDGTTSFQMLQNFLKGSGGSLLYYVFDILYLNGRDLTGLALTERKNILDDLLQRHQGLVPSVRFSTHISGEGNRIFQAACAHGAEGIVSKRSDSPYVQGRSRSWVKVKCIKRQEFVVGGYTKPKGSRQFFGSLLLGYYEDDRLIYCGHVGTGFNVKSIEKIHNQLKKIEKSGSPFDSGRTITDPLNRKVHWTLPRMVAEVEFSGWTDDGLLRHPSFAGVREDKDPKTVTLEREISPPGESEPLHETRTKGQESHPRIPVKLTHPDKILSFGQGLTKRDLAEYYLQISEWLLPEITGRPLSLVRCPQGVEDGCFFQKHLGDAAPRWIESVPIREDGKVELYPAVEDVNGLLSLVQMGTLEIHAWGCRRDHLEHPDRMVFDLDPSPEVSKGQLIEAVLFFKDWLEENKLRSFLKTTGGKGVHLVIPLKPVLSWKEVKDISKKIAQDVSGLKPDMFTAVMTKSKRTGKILIDYMRNHRGSTSILPYSTRARPGAPVALPILKEELTEEFLSRSFDIHQVIRRLKKLKRNPWKDLYE